MITRRRLRGRGHNTYYHSTISFRFVTSSIHNASMNLTSLSLRTKTVTSKTRQYSITSVQKKFTTEIFQKSVVHDLHLTFRQKNTLSSSFVICINLCQF